MTDSIIFKKMTRI